MHDTAEKFKEEVKDRYGIDLQIEEFPEGTKTAEDAARAIGCDLGQIVKSIAMKAGDEIIVVLTSGENQVNTSRLAEHIDTEDSEPADPGEVKEKTGWSIGGVPPFNHKNKVETVLDPKLGDFDVIWAAAGTPKAVFKTSPGQLRRLSNPEEVDVFR